MATVTILLSSYNHKDYISDSINSLLKQSFKSWEAWVLDDASNDGTVELLKSWADKEERIKLFLYEKNQGKAKQLNKVLSEVKSTYIAFLDSDDYWHKEKLNKQIKCFNLNSNIDIVYSDGIIVDSRESEKTSGIEAWHNNLNGHWFSKSHRQPNKRDGNLFKELLRGNFIFYSSVIFKTESLKNIRFSEKITRSMDWLFFIELSKSCNFKYIPEQLASYRVHGKNLQNLVVTSSNKYSALKHILVKYHDSIPPNFRARHNYVMSLHEIKLKNFEEARKLAQASIQSKLTFKALVIYLLSFFRLRLLRYK